MSVLSHLDPFSQHDSKVATAQIGVADSTDLLSDQVAEILKERWQAKLLSLEGWICELLIKNQQLRTTVMEIKAREHDRGRPNG
jgi:hypothetical protein